MKNLYYMIWSDAILRFKKHNPKRSDWKLTLYIYITWMNALNLWIIFIWLKFLNILHIPIIKINVFPGETLDKFLAFTIEFALPFGILNYLLIFYRERYVKITEKYADIKFNYALTYSFSMILGALASAVIYGIFNK